MQSEVSSGVLPCPVKQVAWLGLSKPLAPASPDPMKGTCFETILFCAGAALESSSCGTIGEGEDSCEDA